MLFKYRIASFFFFFLLKLFYYSASHLRKSDRVRNYTTYPFLYYNEIYVLEGGYNSFYNTDGNCFKVTSITLFAFDEYFESLLYDL